MTELQDAIEWRVIGDTPGYDEPFLKEYEINEFGAIRYKSTHGWLALQTPHATTSLTKDYLRFVTNRGGAPYRRKVHQLVADVFINGKWLDYQNVYDVHHINKDKQDNRVENLEVKLKADHRLTTKHEREAQNEE